jgi:hypothetical protein
MCKEHYNGTQTLALRVNPKENIPGYSAAGTEYLNVNYMTSYFQISSF